MSLVCGIDFSEGSARAVAVAAQLASRSGQPLHLVHALEAAPGDDDKADAAAFGRAERRLADAAERAGRLRVRITTHVHTGSPDEVLVTVASELQAELILVGAVGHHRKGALRIGSHAERLAQRAHIPVLVVREAEPFEAWARGERPLRVLLGADATQSSEHSMRWLSGLGKIGPCEVSTVFLYFPPEQFKRLGLQGIRSFLDPAPEVTAALEQEFRPRLRAHGLERSTIHALPHMGRVGDRLATMAREHGTDLIVVGTHPRDGLERFLQGSVSRDVLHSAQGAVACVPAPAVREPARVPLLRRLLVATDFSDSGNAAAPLAYAVATPGAEIHFVHVVPEPPRGAAEGHDILEGRTAHPAEWERLSKLASSFDPEGSAPTSLHVIEADDVAGGICQAAERLDANLICLGTRGRGLSAKVLGSVAQAVVHDTRRPVLLARERTP